LVGIFSCFFKSFPIESFFSTDFSITFHGVFHSIFFSKNFLVAFHGLFRSIFFLYGFFRSFNAVFRKSILCEILVQLVERWAHVEEVMGSNPHEAADFGPLFSIYKLSPEKSV
jgi:hypothetical protein